MEIVYCVQCKNQVEKTDTFCKLCGAAQNRSHRPLPLNSSPNSTSASGTASTPTPGAVSWVWTLIGGSIYFLIKGWWKAGLVSFILALFTGGLSWLAIPFFVQSFVQTIEGHSIGATVMTSAKPQDNLAAIQILADLHSKGIITDAEYQIKRSELIDRI